MATDNTVRLKRLFMRGNYGPEFIRAAKDDLPMIFGRLSLLEEFYSHNAPGFSDRSRNLSEQLERPLPLPKRGVFGRLKSLLVGT